MHSLNFQNTCEIFPRKYTPTCMYVHQQPMRIPSPKFWSTQSIKCFNISQVGKNNLPILIFMSLLLKCNCITIAMTLSLLLLSYFT